jgi:metal-responsive CopG/Arc/MetJ family transcriptional regulator
MANSKAISIRVPDELLEKIDLLAEEKYKSHKGTPNRSLVVLDAIVAYFDTLSDTSKIKDTVSVSDSVSIAEFNELRESFVVLSDTVDQIKEKMSLVSDSVPENYKEPSKQNQLSIIPVSDNVDNSEPSKQSDVGDELAHNQKKTAKPRVRNKSTEPKKTADGVETMTTTQLAARLKLNNEALSKAKSRYKNDVDKFISWSYDRDPEHFAWEFRSGSSLFYRAIPF